MANPVLIHGVESPVSIFEATTQPTHRLGQKAYIDERTFVWASHSGSGISLGNLCATAAATANHVSVAYDDGGAEGSNSISVTLGATAATKNEYRDGWLVPIDGTGSGQLRKIRSHPAANASAALELELYDRFTVSFAAGAELSLIANEYAGVDTHPGTAATGVTNFIPVGVPCFAVGSGTSDAQYFWLQTGGPAMVVGDGSAFTGGAAVIPASSTADAGQVTVQTVTGSTHVVDPVVGYVIEPGDATSDGDYRFVHLILNT